MQNAVHHRHTVAANAEAIGECQDPCRWLTVQVFGELVGLWCVATWRQMGSPSGFRLVELGPGRGTLMDDLLRAASKFDDFTAALERVEMVETSPVCIFYFHYIV